MEGDAARLRKSKGLRVFAQSLLTAGLGGMWLPTGLPLLIEQNVLIVLQPRNVM